MTGDLAVADKTPSLTTWRKAVGVFDVELKKEPQVELLLVHHFSPGVYARELHIPAGVRLTGKIHKFAQLNILSKGELSVLTEHGMVRVKAPFTVVSPPGTQRIAYAHEDSVWTTILATEETNPELIEAHFTSASEEEYLEYLEHTDRLECLGYLEYHEAQPQVTACPS